MDIRGMIVGLGNPGPAYAGNRHNVGFMVADAILAEIAAKPYRRASVIRTPAQAEAWVVSLPRAKGDYLLVKPQTYMNLSGKAVVTLCKDFGVSPRALLVVHDELDLAVGRIKLKLGGGDAGHNGIKSLVQELGTAEFARMRLGVGRPAFSSEVKDWVLTDFPDSERPALGRVVERARDGVALFFASGLVRAQQELHPFDGAEAPVPDNEL